MAKSRMTGGEGGGVATTERNGAYPVESGTPKVQENGGLLTVRCTITGISPLLLNAMSEQQLLQMYGGIKPPKTAARPQPREAADSRVYRLPSGDPCVPTRMMYAALVGAGQFVRLDGKRQISTAAKTVLPSMLVLASGGDLPLLVPGTDKPAPWEVDVQQGRNPNGGEAVCIIRPRFDAWQVQFEIDVDQSVMPLNMAIDLVTKAGKVMGLGDFRPQRRGTFGRFAVTEWKPQG